MVGLEFSKPTLISVLVRVLTDNTTKATLIKTTFNWGWPTGSEIHSIIFDLVAWKHPGRHGPKGAKSSSTSSEGGQKKTGFQAARIWVLKPTCTVTHSNKTTPSNSAAPWAKNIQSTKITVLKHFKVPSSPLTKGRRERCLRGQGGCWPVQNSSLG